MDAPSIITVTMNPTFDRIIEVPRIQIGSHTKGRLRSRLPAGKAINVSRALAMLGRSSTATGWVGRDDLVDFESAMKTAGVSAAFVPIEGNSRENITLIDPESGVETHIREQGPAVAEADIERLQDKLDHLIVKGSIVVFTGSACGEFTTGHFGSMIEACLARGARVAVDASGSLLREATRHDLWLIKPNREELQELADRPLTTEHELIDRVSILARRCRHVVVTLGADGALAINGGTRIQGHMKIDPVQVRSTVGCGDAFLAGYVHGLCTDSREDDRVALRYGLTLGALSAMNEQPAHFDPDSVTEHLARVSFDV